MVDMTTSQTDPTRDTVGRFAEQHHTAPEVGLDADNLTADDLAQNADGHYGWETPLFPAGELTEAEHLAHTESFIDDYFAAPEPAVTGGTVNIFDRAAWGDTPF